VVDEEGGEALAEAADDGLALVEQTGGELGLLA
jgi:hypothetical protein